MIVVLEMKTLKIVKIRMGFCEVGVMDYMSADILCEFLFEVSTLLPLYMVMSKCFQHRVLYRSWCG